MIKLIVASHGKFVEELVQSSYMIFCEQENIFSLRFYLGVPLKGLILSN